jgi:hypothetical protein
MFLARQPPVDQGLLIHEGINHTQWRTALGSTPLDEWWARRRNLYLTTQNTHNRQTSMPTVEIQPTAAAHPRLRPHGHRDQHQLTYTQAEHQEIDDS